MAATVLRARLDTLVASMFASGMLDENFQQLKSMEENGIATPGYVAEMINLFISNTKRILNDIAALLNQPVVDYYMVDVLVRQLKGCSYSVGAKKVNLSCMQFPRLYEPRSKERFLLALAFVWNEFCDVRSKFETMMQGYGPNNLAGLNPPLPENLDVNPSRLSSGARKSKGAILATIIGGGFALLLIAFFSTCVIYRWNKVAKSCYKTDYGHLKSRHFSFAEIQLATKGFDEALIIGRGGFGNVYSGEIDGGTKVAIKRLNQESQQGSHEFQAEIEMLCNFRHGHLVSLIGYCQDNNEMILVYDYMAHGTLREHLYNTRNPPLSWRRRLEICIGAARGLHYLHTGTETGIIHRDVKTSNILLDERFMAKVSDFGLSKAFPAIDNTHVSTAVKGTFGYFDPEYFLLRRLTKKSDVYSFGVMLFEILCARPVINTELPDEQVSLRDWALYCQERGVLEEIVDPCVKEEITPECFSIFAELAEKCVADRSIDRPSMGDVLQNLEVALRLQNNRSYTGQPSSLQIIGLVHSDKASTHSVISVAAQGEIFSDIIHLEGR